jgi:hypothetical protein
LLGLLVRASPPSPEQMRQQSSLATSGRRRVPNIVKDNTMSTQDVPALLIRKLAGFALLIVGGLFAAYGLNYGATGATVGGGLMALVGVIILVLKIRQRNQDQI